MDVRVRAGRDRLLGQNCPFEGGVRAQRGSGANLPENVGGLGVAGQDDAGAGGRVQRGVCLEDEHCVRIATAIQGQIRGHRECGHRMVDARGEHLTGQICGDGGRSATGGVGVSGQQVGLGLNGCRVVDVNIAADIAVGGPGDRNAGTHPDIRTNGGAGTHRDGVPGQYRITRRSTQIHRGCRDSVGGGRIRQHTREQQSARERGESDDRHPARAAEPIERSGPYGVRKHKKLSVSGNCPRKAVAGWVSDGFPLMLLTHKQDVPVKLCGLHKMLTIQD